MAIARVLKQWSLWPLLEKVLGLDEISQAVGWPEKLPRDLQDTWKNFSVAAIETAEKISIAGELEILQCTRHPAGFFTLEVCSRNPQRFWLVDIHPSHLREWRGASFNLMMVTHIEFEFTEDPVTTELLNFSSRLRIKKIKPVR